MEQIPADLPPFRFLGVIRLLEIDAVTGMVKVTAEDGHITYIQPAQALKFAEWAQERKDQLAQAQSRLDAGVQEARRAPVQPTVGRVHERVKALILSVKSVPEESIVPQASLIEDLDFDTADLVLYLLNLEEQFQIQVRDAEAERLLTVGETEDFLSDRGKL